MGKKKNIPQFGKKNPAHDYEDRASVYGVAFNDSGQLLVARARGKIVLPGGGVDPGEKRKQALVREYLEETGYRIKIIEKIGRANEYSISKRRKRASNKTATFYLVAADEQVQDPDDDDHAPEWMDVAEALPQFKRQFFRWAVEQATGRVL
ncbi:MAG: NUDIX domain-containing protein [Alphaproteobacteria bacterium]